MLGSKLSIHPQELFELYGTIVFTEYPSLIKVSTK